MIRERIAEDRQDGSGLLIDPELTTEVPGRDLIAGLPRTTTVGTDEMTETMEPVLQRS